MRPLMVYLAAAALIAWNNARLVNLHADEAPLLNPHFLRDHAETRGFSLGRPTHALPTPDGEAILFLRARPRLPQLELYEFVVNSGTTRLLLSPEDLLKGSEERVSPEEKALRERKRVSVGGFTDFQLSKDGEEILLSLSGRLYVVQRRSRQVRELKSSDGAPLDPKFAPDGRKVAYVLGSDVYVYDLVLEQEHRVTSGGTADVAHGSAEFVAREEMLRFSGYWWAPDSKAIAYQESDSRAVETWYVADPAKPGNAPDAVRYPRPGKPNVKVRLGVVPVSGGSTTWIEWDHERYPYMTTVIWDEHGPLTVAVQSRDQKQLELLEADPNTGRTQSLLSEHDDSWVNVRQDVPRWLAGNKGFIWAHERAGSGWQLEWHNRNGEFKRVVVPSTAGFRSLIDVDAESGDIAFTARPDPTQWRLYRASLDGSEVVELTHEPGCHGGQFDQHHSVFVDSHSNSESMTKTTVYRRNGTVLGELPSVAEEPPFRPHVEIARLGKEPGLYTALVRPRDFDGRKQYPTIVEVYGGPLPDWYSGTVVDSMQAWLLTQWIADQGFIVVSIDGRGTPGRGHDWERAIAKNFGSVPLADQIAGLNLLGQKHRELDLGRVGIYGWSFGGYMSALAVLKEPGVFKAAVAGAPPTDWLDYDTQYTERYLGIPPADASAYEDASLLKLAPGLDRPLLLVHGTGDDNVYFRHSLRLVDALFRAGKRCEILPLSGLTHMVPDPIVNEQLYSRLVRYFKEHLSTKP